MEEEKDKQKDQPEDKETIEAVKEEYDKKIAEIIKGHEDQIKKLKEDHVNEIRQLIAGSNVQPPKEEKVEDDDPLDPDVITENLRKKFNLK